MKSSHEVWSALATILKEANWTHLAICSLRKEKSEKRREWDRGGRVSGVLQRQALPKVKNDLRGEHCRRAQHGPCTRRGLCSAAKEVRFVLVEAARPRKKARSCVRTLRKSGCSLYTQRPPDSPSDCTVFFTFLSPGKNYFENPL